MEMFNAERLYMLCHGSFLLRPMCCSGPDILPPLYHSAGRGSRKFPGFQAKCLFSPRGCPMFQFPTLTILLPGDIVPLSNRQRWRRSRKIRPERDAEAGSVLRVFAAGTTPEPLANAECRMQNAEWTSTLPLAFCSAESYAGPARYSGHKRRPVLGP